MKNKTKVLLKSWSWKHLIYSTILLGIASVDVWGALPITASVSEAKATISTVFDVLGFVITAGALLHAGMKFAESDPRAVRGLIAAIGAGILCQAARAVM